MNSKESGSHHKPHVYVKLSSGESASIAIEDGEVFAGNVPTQKLREIQENIKGNQEYLFQCWNDMTDGFYHDINYHFGEIELVTG